MQNQGAKAYAIGISEETDFGLAETRFAIGEPDAKRLISAPPKPTYTTYETASAADGPELILWLNPERVLLLFPALGRFRPLPYPPQRQRTAARRRRL